jgi:hypothetical protein
MQVKIHQTDVSTVCTYSYFCFESGIHEDIEMNNTRKIFIDLTKFISDFFLSINWKNEDHTKLYYVMVFTDNPTVHRQKKSSDCL